MLSRCLGCALLAASLEKEVFVALLVGELALYMLYKVVRGDLIYWVRLDGGAIMLLSTIERLFAKILADFTGSLHLRHPYELGGLAFSLSMVWAQILPFIALQFYEGDIDKITSPANIQTFLICSFCSWLLLNLVFFSTCDLAFLSTFFSTKSAKQYSCDIFLTCEDDAQKFDTVSNNERSHA